MTRRLSLLFAPLLLGATGSAWSPVGCGCIDRNEMVAWLYDMPASALDDAAAVEAALARRFAQGPVALKEIEAGYCERIDQAPRIACRWWLWRKPGLRKALDVTLWLDDAGALRGARAAYTEAPEGAAAGG